MPSFNRLPSEIKHLIVKEVYLSDISSHVEENVPIFFRKDNSFGPSDFKNGMAPKESSIASVAFVDKQMHAICKEFLCRILDLRGLTANDKRIYENLTTHINQYQKYIQSVICPLIVFQQAWLDYHKGMLGHKNSELEWVEQVMQTLDTVATSPTIKKIELNLAFLPPAQDSVRPIVYHPLTQQTLDCVSKFQNLDTFCITTDTHLKVPEDMVLSAIRQMTRLESVSLDNISKRCEATNFSYPDSTQLRSQQISSTDQSIRCKQHSLGQYLSQSSTLKDLSLTNSDCVDKDWSGLPWGSTKIDSINFRNCLHLSPKCFQSILKRLQHTLKYCGYFHTRSSELELLHTELEPTDIDTTIPPEKISLNQLTHLVLSGFSLEEDVLFLFRDCPRVMNAIIHSPNIRAHSVTSLIKSWPQLSTLDLNVRGGKGSMDLILHCSKNVIQLDEAFY